MRERKEHRARAVCVNSEGAFTNAVLGAKRASFNKGTKQGAHVAACARGTTTPSMTTTTMTTSAFRRKSNIKLQDGITRGDREPVFRRTVPSPFSSADEFQRGKRVASVCAHVSPPPPLPASRGRAKERELFDVGEKGCKNTRYTIVMSQKGLRG